MIVGTRVLYPDDVERYSADMVQISAYRGMPNNMEMMKDCVNACKKSDIRYVIHPVGYSLLNHELMSELRLMAEWADLSLILHDERSPDGQRLSGEWEHIFRDAVQQLNAITAISFENATDTEDVQWFWKSFADSITLDIGHIESAGLDSVEYVQSLDDAVFSKIDYIHMHRNNGLRGGITDHWPLHPECREVQALRELLKIDSDVTVILELNEVEKIEESTDILRSLQDEILS